MARYKSESLHRRYRGRLRPITHYVLGWLPRWTRLASSSPATARLANLALNLPALKPVALAAAGVDARRGLPRFAARTFRALAARSGVARYAGAVPAQIGRRHCGCGGWLGIHAVLNPVAGGQYRRR